MPGPSPIYRPDFPLRVWSRPGGAFGNGRWPLNGDNVPGWCCSGLPIHGSPMWARQQRGTSLPRPCGIGGDAGPVGRFAWKMPRVEAGRPGFPPLDHALVNAIACAAVHSTGLPLRRLSTADFAAQASRARGKPISPSMVWRSLDAAAIQRWRYTYGIFPRAPHVAEQARCVRDWSAGYWPGEALGPKAHCISADAKARIPAGIRCHASLPPAPGRVSRIEPADERGGAWHYLAAWDVQRGMVMARCAPSTGLAPFGRLVAQVLEREPYGATARVCWGGWVVHPDSPGQSPDPQWWGGRIDPSLVSCRSSSRHERSGRSSVSPIRKRRLLSTNAHTTLHALVSGLPIRLTARIGSLTIGHIGTASVLGWLGRHSSLLHRCALSRPRRQYSAVWCARESSPRI